jgi:universal stress protein E
VHPFNPILAVIDPTTYGESAASKAARLAKETGSRLHLLVCDYEAAFADDPLYDSDSLRRQRTAYLAERKGPLDELARRYRAHGCEVSTAVHWSARLHDGILDVAAELEPGLVVKDTHYHTALRRSLFTNTDWHLIRECPWPLLLAKPGDWHEEPRVVAALDLEGVRGKSAALDDSIVAAAERLRGALRADLHLVHACNDAALLAAAAAPGTRPMPEGIDTTELLRMEHRRLEAALASLTEARRARATRIHVQPGSAVAVLLELAGKLAADVVVMGAVSRSDLRARVLGSTAERTLDRLGCDLLVVKTTAS